MTSELKLVKYLTYRQISRSCQQIFIGGLQHIYIYIYIYNCYKYNNKNHKQASPTRRKGERRVAYKDGLVSIASGYT